MAKLTDKVTSLANAPASRVVAAKDIALAEGDEREQFLMAVADRYPAADVDETKSGMVCFVTVPGLKGSNISIYPTHAIVTNALLELAEGHAVLNSW